MYHYNHMDWIWTNGTQTELGETMATSLSDDRRHDGFLIGGIMPEMVWLSPVSEPLAQ